MPELNDITDLNFADKITERTKVSTDGSQVRVEQTQNCSPIIDAVQAARDLPKLKNMRHAGSVPLVLYHKWMVEAGIRPGDPDTTRKMVEVIKRKFASNEYHALVVNGF